MKANGSLTSKEFREQRRFDKRFREKAKHKVPPSYSRAEESARSPNGRRDNGLLMEEYKRGARPTSVPSPAATKAEQKQGGRKLSSGLERSDKVMGD